MVNIVLLWLHDDERANNATMAGVGTPHGVTASVEFARVDMTGTGIAVARRVVWSCRGNNNIDSRSGAERRR